MKLVARTAGCVSLAVGILTAPMAGTQPEQADRVSPARKNVVPGLKSMARAQGLSYPLAEIYIRAFKQERELEIWATNKPGDPMKKLGTYTVVAASGVLGPKRREGDLQVPEGFYHIDRFNPRSRFHLSLGINYPNTSDRVRSDSKKPGGDIFIHGNQVSIGCLAMTDPIIEQIYVLADEARTAGQKKIPVHIFPFRMTKKALDEQSKTSTHLDFWKELKPGFDDFEKTKRPPQVSVSKTGAYTVKLRG